ncbi:MAG: site-specific DNA-methyltransferase [Candidatus Freyarchaeum deiterrae]
MNSLDYDVICGDCLSYLKQGNVPNVSLTFLDPPFNQGKEYKYFDDEQNPEVYWGWLKEIIQHIYETTVDGGAIYFMQREKNVDWMMKVLKETGWNYQNLIIWKKFTSAIPGNFRFGKHYQVIIFATKGERPRVFNRLRIDYPLRPNHKHKRPNGIYLTDVWDDVRELTSGYFAGDEALRDEEGKRVHEQQSPIELLLRITLSSTSVGDTVFDPFAGSGTTLVVAHQLKRKSIGIEIDPSYVEVVKKRLKTKSSADDILKYRNYYRFTPNLDEVWLTEGLERYIDD